MPIGYVRFIIHKVARVKQAEVCRAYSCIGLLSFPIGCITISLGSPSIGAIKLLELIRQMCIPLTFRR